MEWITTTTILDGLRDYGNRDAWDRLVGRFRHPIAAFARETGVAQRDCEDVAQEALAAFAEAYRAGRYDRTRGRLGSWLFGIAYRHAMRRRRAEARHPPAPDPGGDAAIPDEAADVWTRIWERHLLESAITAARYEFAPDTFRAFRHVVLEDRTPAEAADAMGVPVKTIYNAKHRVLRRVRELLRELEDADVLP